MLCAIPFVSSSQHCFPSFATSAAHPQGHAAVLHHHPLSPLPTPQVSTQFLFPPRLSCSRPPPTTLPNCECPHASVFKCNAAACLIDAPLGYPPPQLPRYPQHFQPSGAPPVVSNAYYRHTPKGLNCLELFCWFGVSYE